MPGELGLRDFHGALPPIRLPDVQLHGPVVCFLDACLSQSEQQGLGPSVVYCGALDTTSPVVYTARCVDHTSCYRNETPAAWRNKTLPEHLSTIEQLNNLEALP